MSEEIIVEGLSPNDFKMLEKILKTYKVSLDSEVKFHNVVDLYNKVKQITDYLEE